MTMDGAYGDVPISLTGRARIKQRANPPHQPRRLGPSSRIGAKHGKVHDEAPDSRLL